MIVLSYSTINALINEPHTYLCKVMGLETFSTRYMEEGKQAHRIIQDHVSGIKRSSKLEHIDLDFPEVEVVEKDPNMEFYFKINEKYAIHGFFDGKNQKNKQFLEIKTSGTPWTLGKFENLMQWRVYALACPMYEQVVMLTCTRQVENIKVYSRHISQKDRDQALNWILKGIEIIERGDFKYIGSGRSPYCFYKNCPFCS